MKLVQFTVKMSPWNIGETAGFPSEKAEELVSKGLAVYLDVDVPQKTVEVVESVVTGGARRGRQPRQW